MNSSIDTDQLLWELNNEKARLFIPAILFVGILMLVGIVGNCMVLYFYGYKSKTSPSTSFIIALAIFDMVTCLISMPMEIADMRYFFNFKSEPACKILRLVTHFASISSGLTLVAIAIDRYRRICKPFESQLSNKHVKIMCIVVGVVSALLSWPAVVFNQVVEVEVDTNEDTTIVGHDCTTTKEDSLRPYMFAFNITYLVAFIIITFVLAVLYTLISRQLFKHKKFRFYVAKRVTKVRRINVRPGNGSSENLITPRDVRTETQHSGESESIVDMKEFVTTDLPEVEQDRPTSGYTAITGTTCLTGLTDITGRSKRSMQSRKSVQICDPSQNTIYAIEAREETKILSNTNGLEIADGRPGSASSLATFSSRPSSAALSMFSDFSRAKPVNSTSDENDTGNCENDDDDENNDVFAEPNENREPRLRDIGHNVKKYLSSREKTTEWINKSLRFTSPVEISSKDDAGESAVNEDTQETVPAKEPNTELPHLSEIMEETNDDVTEERNVKEEGEHEHISEIMDENIDQVIGESNEMDETEIGQEQRTVPNEALRPQSKESERSKRSKSSTVSRRSNVVTPATDVTMASNVASRASTVRHLKRLLRDNAFKDSKMNTDTDSVKDLRMKMLDISTIKYTMIMLVITILFVVSFLPYISLVIWRYYHEDHEVNIMTDFELVMFQIGIRSVFLNSSLNPLIYGGFNSKFRAFFYGMFCSCKKWTKMTKPRQSRDQSESTSET